MSEEMSIPELMKGECQLEEHIAAFLNSCSPGYRPVARVL